jgi:NitT/TauT family transport system substrate-binding protein
MKLLKSVTFTLGMAGLLATAPSFAAAPQKIDMVVFGQPSLGAFFQPIIKSQKLDLKHGIDLNFIERTPNAYIMEFNSGEFQVGGSAALLSIGIARNKGVKVSYLFNLFDYFGGIVTDKNNVRTLKDLEGKKLIAATATTNFAMCKWLLQRQGVDVSKIAVQNTATPGLIGYALADRGDAVELWEPGYSILMSRKPSLRTLNLDIQGQWKKFSGTSRIPYLGVAAHDSWIKAHPDLVKKMYDTFKDASVWVHQHPAEAGNLIAASIKGAQPAVINALLTHDTRLGMDVEPAANMSNSIRAVYRAGLQSHYYNRPVDQASIYPGKLN